MVLRCSATIGRFLTSNPIFGSRKFVTVVTPSGSWAWPIPPDDAVPAGM
jgi:hypothetical protein